MGRAKKVGSKKVGKNRLASKTRKQPAKKTTKNEEGREKNRNGKETIMAKKYKKGKKSVAGRVVKASKSAVKEAKKAVRKMTPRKKAKKSTKKSKR
jgi:hypothetical protein